MVLYSLLVLLACVIVDVYPIITPPNEYSVEAYFKMALKQKDFVLDAYELNFARINPSMIRDPHNKDRIIMVWRKGRERNSKIGYTSTDSKSWEAQKDIRTIEILDKNATKPEQTELIGEDPRISSLNGQLILTYNIHKGKYKTFHLSNAYYHQRPAHLAASHSEFDTNTVPMWESAVTKASEIFYILPAQQRNIVFEEDRKGDIQRHQKNWSPFEYCPMCVYYQGSVAVHESGHYRAHLLFSYSLQPHIVVQVHDIPPTVGSAATVTAEPAHHDRNHIVSNSVAETVFATEMLPEFEWQWGEMRGGTPALLVGDSYLAFFHSSGRLNHKTVISYVMGAYMFQREPPFAITHMSPEPIIHPSMVNETLGWAYKVVDYIVFPMGFVFDDQHLYLSYGKNDKSSWLLKFEKEGLIASLRPVKTRVLGSSEYDKITGNIERYTYVAADTKSSG